MKREARWIYFVEETGKYLTCRMDRSLPKNNGLEVELPDGLKIHQCWADYQDYTDKKNPAPRTLPDWLSDETPAKWDAVKKELVPV